MTLRWRLALAMAVLAAVAALTAGTVSYQATRQRLYHEIDSSLRSATSLIERGGVGGGNEPPGPGPFNQYVLTLWSSDGTVVGGLQGLDLDDAERAVMGHPRRAVDQTRSMGGVSYRFRTVGTEGGALRIGRDLSETNRILSSLRLRIAVIVAAVTALAAALGALVAGTLTRPLRRLTAAADVVGRTGRLDVRVDLGGARRGRGDRDRSDLTGPDGPNQPDGSDGPPRRSGASSPGQPSHGSAGVPDGRGRDEVGRLAGSFERMLDALARSRDDQHRLVQDAGHELRTPLTSLRTNLDVLRRFPDLDAAQRREVVSDLQAETDELVTLVNELVSVASGVIDDEPLEEVAAGDVARRLAERYERRSGRRVIVDADDSVVVAPPQGFQRAVSNLLDNARKFDDCPAPIELTVHAGEVAVADHGPGIPPGDLDRIFDRFHRADAARTLPGSGLGLSIVADVVRRAGGTVFATNRDGGGAVVGFRLPPS